MDTKGFTVALWGSPSSGKTATTVKLALSLVEENKSVIAVFPEDTAPAIPCICAESEYSHRGTLGSVFIAPKISASLISYQLTTLGKIPALAFLGFGKGENRYTYPAPTTEQCEELLAQCANMADFVLVDVSSSFTKDLLSTTALLGSDCILRTETPDIKNVAYLSGNLALLTDHPKFSAEKQIRLLTDRYDLPKDTAKLKRNYDLLIPYCEELIVQSRMGNLINGLKEKSSFHYKKAIKKLTEMIPRKVDHIERNNKFFL